jgi:hypothetical protein
MDDAVPICTHPSLAVLGDEYQVAKNDKYPSYALDSIGRKYAKELRSSSGHPTRPMDKTRKTVEEAVNFVKPFPNSTCIGLIVAVESLS